MPCKSEPIEPGHKVTIGVYGRRGESRVSFVVALGKIQLRYIPIECPMEAVKQDIEDFLREHDRRYTYRPDEAARKFLLAAEDRMPSALVLTTLRELSGLDMLD